MKEFYACNIKRNKTVRINSKKVSLLAVLDIFFKLSYILKIEATYFCTFLNLNDFCFLDSETALRRSTVIKKKRFCYTSGVASYLALVYNNAVHSAIKRVMPITPYNFRVSAN